MKAVRFLAALFALALVGCGDGSIKSPDFTSELASLTISPATANLALGTTQQFTAVGTCTTQDGTTAACTPGGLSWKTGDTSIATIDSSGLLQTVAQGTVTVTASKDGITSNTATVTVGAPVLKQIVVYTVVDGTATTSSSASVPLGATQDLKALGVYTDSSTPRDINLTSTPVTWSSGNTAVATVSPTSGVITTVTPVAKGSATITAAATSEDGTALSGTATISVTDALLTQIVRLEPSSASVAVGKSQTFQAVGEFADGTEAVVDSSSFDWTSSDTAIATVNTTDQPGVATGVAQGAVTITATLKAAVATSGSQRSATASLSVSNAACLSALLESQGATTAVEAGGLLGALSCIGCIVDDEHNVIDADSTNYANMIVPVGLAGNLSLTVSAADGTVFDASSAAPHTTGFVIGRPAGQLLSAELLAQLQVSTLLDGVVQESSSDGILLRLTLLGLLGDNNQALITMDATKNYDAIRLTYSGVVAALTTTQVYSACDTATVPDTE